MSSQIPRRTFLQHLTVGGSFASALLATGVADRQAKGDEENPTTSKTQTAVSKMPKPGYMLPALHYPYNALEPAIDERTVRIHYDKHHTGYAKKYNQAVVDRPDVASQPLEDLFANMAKLSPAIQTAVRHNGAGAYNHTLYWRCMAPAGSGGGEPKGELVKAIDRDLGSFKSFKESFSKAAATQFASGWAWLTVDKAGKLFVCSTPNHDNPLMVGFVERTGTPILTLDVWEHAYYLKYQNRRTDYIAAFWSIVNWPGVEALFSRAKR